MFHPAGYTTVFVHGAVDFYEKEGIDATVAYYNTPESTDGEWYLFLVDGNNRMIAQAAIPELLGMDFATMLTPDGHPIGEEIIRDAAEEGTWFRFEWLNVETGQNSIKHGYVVRRDGMLFGSGYYEAEHTVALSSTEERLNIRLALPRDEGLVAQFNAAMALESEAIVLDMDVLTAGVRAALADSGRAFYLLAEVNNAAVGQLMVTYEWSDWRNGWIWWIQSVYVKPEFRRQGVYSNLFRRLETMADDQGDVRGIRLYVLRENHVAKQTYESLGMHHSEYDLYETEFGPS